MTTTPEPTRPEHGEYGPTPPPAQNVVYYPPPPGYSPPSRVSGQAIAAFVLGVIWLGGLGSLIAVVLGHSALGQIRRNEQSTEVVRVEGRGLAIAGLVLGYIGVAGLLLFLVAMNAASTY